MPGIGPAGEIAPAGADAWHGLASQVFAGRRGKRHAQTVLLWRTCHWHVRVVRNCARRSPARQAHLYQLGASGGTDGAPRPVTRRISATFRHGWGSAPSHKAHLCQLGASGGTNGAPAPVTRRICATFRHEWGSAPSHGAHLCQAWPCGNEFHDSQHTMALRERFETAKIPCGNANSRKTRSRRATLARIRCANALGRPTRHRRVHPSRVQVPGPAPEMKNAPSEGRGFTWWSGRDLNPRHGDFQSPALPTELPDQLQLRVIIIRSTRIRSRGNYRMQEGFTTERNSAQPRSLRLLYLPAAFA